MCHDFATPHYTCHLSWVQVRSLPQHNAATALPLKINNSTVSEYDAAISSARGSTEDENLPVNCVALRHAKADFWFVCFPYLLFSKLSLDFLVFISRPCVGQKIPFCLE